MELLYIWINEYRGIKKVGLNLSNEFSTMIFNPLTQPSHFPVSPFPVE